MFSQFCDVLYMFSRLISSVQDNQTIADHLGAVWSYLLRMKMDLSTSYSAVRIY